MFFLFDIKLVHWQVKLVKLQKAKNPSTCSLKWSNVSTLKVTPSFSPLFKNNCTEMFTILVLVLHTFTFHQGAIYFTCLLLTIGEAYGLRCRHLIMACYEPRRERRRAIWLFNHILKTRGDVMEQARKRIKERRLGNAAPEAISLKGRLAAR